MISFSKVRDVIVEKGFRILRVFQYGIKTADVVGPFGEDSSPLENTTAIYCKTSEKGENVVVGYINKNQLTKVSPGEKRIFSLKPDGSESFEIYLKGDGTCEIGGDQFSSIKFEPLEQILTAYNTSLNAELAKIVASIAGVGGTYAVTPLNLDISSSKSKTIKTGE